jgi:hypothetical protein
MNIKPVSPLDEVPCEIPSRLSDDLKGDIVPAWDE